MNAAKKFSILFSALIPFAIPSQASVTVNSPMNGDTVDSPFHLSAIAVACSSQDVGQMGYSLDGSPDSTIFDGTSIEAQVQSSSGPHTVHVKAWTSTGAVCVTDVNVTVKVSAGNGKGESVVPSYATTVSNLQSMRNWVASGDKGAVGHSSGSTTLVSSPAIHGPSRRFVTHYSGSGDERYSLNFGDDRTATNFFYDAWVYLTDSANDVANVEMDMNQVVEDGQTIIMGVQCDGYTGTWDFTLNEGTAKRQKDHWAHSRAGCNPRSWSKNAWHHVQAFYSHNGAGKVTYHTVWLDGVAHPINATVYSAFALGWGGDLITNFQVDGRGSGSNTVYIDSLTVSRW